ncbi:hypothetical protein GCM10027046_07710 [Uliginosibacterium flavum]
MITVYRTQGPRPHWLCLSVTAMMKNVASGKGRNQGGLSPDRLAEAGTGFFKAFISFHTGATRNMTDREPCAGLF